MSILLLFLDSKKPAGVLEMGGASTQIAFQPKGCMTNILPTLSHICPGSILANKFPVRIAGTTYPLYVHSYLYYGQNYASKWVRETLAEQNKGQSTIDNPCMLKGMHCYNTPGLFY